MHKENLTESDILIPYLQPFAYNIIVLFEFVITLLGQSFLVIPTFNYVSGKQI